MWSAKGVASLKESFKQSGLKFEPLKKETDVKVYKQGEEISIPTGGGDDVTTPSPQQPIPQQSAFIPTNYEIDDHQTTTSTSDANGQIKRLVLDSGAFITGANLTLYGANCEYYTIQDVIDELKDDRARQTFASFPLPITVRVPSASSMQYITNMSTQTGDYYVLSATDRKVLALCHQLEIESHGKRFIKDSISTPTQATQDTQQPQSENKPNKKKATKPTTTTTTTAPTQSTDSTPTADGEQQVVKPIPKAKKQPEVEQGWATLYPGPSQPFTLQSLLMDAAPTPEPLPELPPGQLCTQLPPVMGNHGFLCYPSLFETYTPQAVTETTKSNTKQTKKKESLRFNLPGFDDGEWISPTSKDKLMTNAQLSHQLGNAGKATISSLEANHYLAAPMVGTEFIGPMVESQSTQPTCSDDNGADGGNTVNKSAGRTTTKTTTNGNPNNNNNNNNNSTNDPNQQQQYQQYQQYQQPHQHANQPKQISLSSVGCITTDYSMQNVMLQCGLRCLTLDGRAIATIRQYIMGCHACFTLSKDMSRGFCPSCGGFTMVRLIVNVDKRGNAYYHWPMARIENKRGTTFQLSRQHIFGTKKGTGKIILREDMLPKPKLKQLLIARGEKTDPNAEKSLFDESALFGFMRQYQQKTATYGFGKRNMNVARRRK